MIRDDLGLINEVENIKNKIELKLQFIVNETKEIETFDILGSVELQDIQKLLLFNRRRRKNVDYDERLLKGLFDLLWIDLKRWNSSIRYFALTLFDFFLVESEGFRNLLIGNRDLLNLLLELTIIGSKPPEKIERVETKIKKMRKLPVKKTPVDTFKIPNKEEIQIEEKKRLKKFGLVLPPPAESGTVLRKKGLECIEKWSAIFSKIREFRSALQYLKNSFPEFPFPREEERERQIFLRHKFQRVKTEYNEMYWETALLFKKINNCFEILVPSFGILEPLAKTDDRFDGFDKFDSSGEEWIDVPLESGVDSIDKIVGECGLVSKDFVLEIEIKEDAFDDSFSEYRCEIVVETVKSLMKEVLFSTFPMLKEWKSVLSSVRFNSSEKDLEESRKKIESSVTSLIGQGECFQKQCHDLKIEIGNEELRGKRKWKNIYQVEQPIFRLKKRKRETTNENSDKDGFISKRVKIKP